MIHDAHCRRSTSCSCFVTTPLPHEIRRARELAYRAGEPVPVDLALMSRPQIRVLINRLQPLEQQAVRRARGVRV